MLSCPFFGLCERHQSILPFSSLGLLSSLSFHLFFWIFMMLRDEHNKSKILGKCSLVLLIFMVCSERTSSFQ